MISIFQLFPSSGEKTSTDTTKRDGYTVPPVSKSHPVTPPVKSVAEDIRVGQVPVTLTKSEPKPTKQVEDQKEVTKEKTKSVDADDEPIGDYPPNYFTPMEADANTKDKEQGKVTETKNKSKWARDDQAFVFLLTNDQPMHLIWALEGSLRDVNSTRRRIVLATPKVSAGVKDTLTKLGMEVRDIEQPQHKNFKTQFAHWADTLAKLFIFDLPGIKQFIYLDADTMVNKNVDYLFDKNTDAMVYAMRDVIDCSNGNPHMNAGLLVARPNATLKAELFGLLEDEHFFKDRKGDQEMLDVYLQRQYVPIQHLQPFQFHSSRMLVKQRSSLSNFLVAPCHQSNLPQTRLVRYLSSSRSGMLTLLPETAMSFLVRCNCLRHKTITHYELDVRSFSFVWRSCWYRPHFGLSSESAHGILCS